MPRTIAVPQYRGRPYGGGGFGERRVHRRLRGMTRMSEVRRGYFEDPAFNPSRMDFIGSSLPVELVFSGMAGTSATIIAANGGVLEMATATGVTDLQVESGSLSMDRTFNPRSEMRVKLGQTANHITRVGYADTGATNDAIFFRHQPGVSANWIAVNRTGGVETTSDTGVAATTDWTEMEIEVDDDLGIAGFYIADADTTMIERATLTTLTGNGLQPAYMYLQNALSGARRTLQVDYFRTFYRRVATP